VRRKIGRVLFNMIVLKNGQMTVRERILIHCKRDKLFIDSAPAEEVKIYMCESEKVLTSNEDGFSIWIKIEAQFEPPEDFIIEIGDVKFEIEMLFRRSGIWCFRVKKILKFGFVKSGNEVFLC
jgi:hypothetical protein